MQRNLTYQTALLGLSYVIAYLIYISMSSIYLFLPPLLGVLFWHYRKALRQQNFSYLLMIVAMLLILEVEKGFLLFSSVVYLGLFQYIVVPKLQQYINCRGCLNFIYVALLYLGYLLFSWLIHQVFWMPLPSIDWYIVYYIVIEFLIVSTL
ncbi:MAG: hypothetical protein U9Q62_07705 [Campylobacterota bacterium]|nr:hypothetical protein [Campylobacterota bacterium]